MEYTFFLPVDRRWSSSIASRSKRGKMKLKLTVDDGRCGWSESEKTKVEDEKLNRKWQRREISNPQRVALLERRLCHWTKRTDVLGFAILFTNRVLLNLSLAHQIITLIGSLIEKLMPNQLDPILISVQIRIIHFKWNYLLFQSLYLFSKTSNEIFQEKQVHWCNIVI